MRSREPLWTEADGLPVATGLRTDRREVIVTTVSEAEPESFDPSPTPSLWPLAAAIATSILFVGSIFTPWAVLWGSIPVGITLIGWFWPKGDKEDEA